MPISNQNVEIHISTKKVLGGNAQTIASVIASVRSNSAMNAYNFSRRTATSAQLRVHVITGRLKASIVSEKVGYGKHRVVVGMYYGVYEEYGTRHRPPHPYLRPALEENKALFMQDMKKVFHR